MGSSNGNLNLDPTTISFALMVSLVLLVLFESSAGTLTHNAIAQKRNNTNNVTGTINFSNNTATAITRSPTNNIGHSPTMFGMRPSLPAAPFAAASNVTGSIPLFSVISNVLAASKHHVSLSNATINAEKTSGSNSHAVLARLGFDNGFLVYTVWIIGPNNNLHKVIVDAGNGKVLTNQQLSLFERKQIEMGLMTMASPALPLPPGGLFIMRPPPSFPAPSSSGPMRLPFPPPPPTIGYPPGYPPSGGMMMGPPPR